MKTLLCLMLLILCCDALPAEKLQQKIQDESFDGIPSKPTLPDVDDSPINRLLLVIWTELSDLTEEMKQLSQTVTNMQVASDNMQSAMFILTKKVGNLEDSLEDIDLRLTATETTLNNFNNSNGFADELEELENTVDARFIEHDVKLLELDYSILYNATQLSEQDAILQSDIQEHDAKLLELDSSILSTTSQLHDDDLALQKDIQDVEQQCQQNNTEVMTKLSELEQEVHNNYEELKGKGYRYEISLGYYHVWQDARDYCQSLGGDLAHYGLDTKEKRDEILCGSLKQCDLGEDRYIMWGLRKKSGTADEWEYLNGYVPEDNEIMWTDDNQKSSSGEDCGMIHVNEDDAIHLQTYSHICDYHGIEHYALCQFKI